MESLHPMSSVWRESEGIGSTPTLVVVGVVLFGVGFGFAGTLRD